MNFSCSLGQQVRSELSGQSGPDRLLEEEPEMPPVTGPGALEGERQPEVVRDCSEGLGVFAPAFAVEINQCFTRMPPEFSRL